MTISVKKMRNGPGRKPKTRKQMDETEQREEKALCKYESKWVERRTLR